MIFVTGGAGYIGSQTCVELLNAGLNVTVFDNFCNSQPEALARVARITGKMPTQVQGDVRDRAALTAALSSSGARAVIHFAGLKAVSDSVANPLAYYDNNVAGTLCLLQAMMDCDVKTLVFSSSATVYGKPVPYKLMPRRAGDIAACYADPSLALNLLGWRAQRDLAAMCLDAWRWQSGNPNGYSATL